MAKYVYYAVDYDSDSMAHSIAALDILKKTGSNVASSVRSAVNKAGGAIEREWKKHKWVARKRGKNGKWIYDYGKGFTDESGPKKIKVIDPKEKSRKAQAMRSKRLRQQNLRDAEKANRNFNKLDYDSDDSIKVNGVRMQKDETGEAYVRSRNPYKGFSRGSNVVELSRRVNEEKQKRGRGVKTHRGKQVY